MGVVEQHVVPRRRPALQVALQLLTRPLVKLPLLRKVDARRDRQDSPAVRAEDLLRTQVIRAGTKWKRR